MTNLRGYSLVTAAYWGFTLTDGALRMLVLLNFHRMGFSPVQLAFLFLLYEFFGVVTNLTGGWIGSRFGLRLTLYLGLAFQIISLIALAQVNETWGVVMSVVYVMITQALSGIAKDLTKMSSKSAVRLLAPQSDDETGLFKWVAILTGSKNTLKGVGFFLGALLLGSLGFVNSLYAMAGALTIILAIVLICLRDDMGKTKDKIKFTQLFSKTQQINYLSLARFFLFASRDVWFVVALPIFLSETMAWSFYEVGTFMACWIIGYGIVQALVPTVSKSNLAVSHSHIWGGLLVVITVLIGVAISFDYQWPVLIGLCVFGVIFAFNSSLHSFLILSFSNADKVALDVGFYYMANAVGRLVGTLLSGLVYLWAGLAACLWTSAIFVLAAVLLTFKLRTTDT